MKSGSPETAVAPIAAAIGEAGRSRMLYALLDGRARTSTELAVIADVSPSTASIHLQRLKSLNLVTAIAQGKHRYYSLHGTDVASALEALHVVAGGSRPFVSPAPERLRTARTCYDHIAGTLGVAIFDRLVALAWITCASRTDGACELRPAGRAGFAALGIDVDAALAQRRRFAFACLDWSERRPHLGGALGAEVLRAALRRRWVERDLDTRALRVTRSGRRELASRLGVTSA